MHNLSQMAILDDLHRVIPCPIENYPAWASRDDEPWRVACDIIGPYRVSTVFLKGVFYGTHTTFAPFETAIFKDIHPGEKSYRLAYGVRHFRWEDAREAHQRIVVLVHAGILP